MEDSATTTSHVRRPLEWLAGVTAVGLLSAVLIPVYAGDHGPRAASRTMSQLKQVAVGTIIYSADYHEFVPPYGHFSSKEPTTGKKITGDQMAWKTSLEPYITNEEIFYTSDWPFLDQKGEQIELVRGTTNNGSSFGYTENMTAKLVGSPNGWFVLNLASPSQELIEPYGSAAKTPMFEELDWTVDKRFGQKEVQRSSQKVGLRAIARLDSSFAMVKIQD